MSVRPHKYIQAMLLSNVMLYYQTNITNANFSSNAGLHFLNLIFRISSVCFPYAGKLYRTKDLLVGFQSQDRSHWLWAGNLDTCNNFHLVEIRPSLPFMLPSYLMSMVSRAVSFCLYFIACLQCKQSKECTCLYAGFLCTSSAWRNEQRNQRTKVAT